MNNSPHQPALIVHGGAGPWQGIDHQAALEGVHQAVQRGWSLLLAGMPALDVVEQTIWLLEDHPLFDAGYGSYPNKHGEVEMDALIADGRTVNFGAVAAVKYVKNPITLAKKVLLDTDHTFIVGAGADMMALEFGVQQSPNLALVTPAQYEDFTRYARGQMVENAVAAVGTGTVGAVAYDAYGNLAAGTSTGGTQYKRAGRVGDTPIFGGGGYADNRFGAVSATGHGESIMRFLLSKHLIDQIALPLSAYEAAQATIHHFEAVFPHTEAGFIVIDAQGRIAAAHTSLAMPIAWVNGDGEIHAQMRVEAFNFIS